MRKHLLLFFLAALGMALAVQAPVSARMLKSDGFVAAKQLDTFYFTVSLAPGVDEAVLTESLDEGMPAGIVSKPLEEGDDAPVSGLGMMLDGFYEWATDVLDMRVADYHGEIKVVPDEERLQDIYQRLYGIKSSEKSFYLYEENTLYVAAPDFTKEVVGHELGHMVVSNYFVVQPSAKAAEVLAGYIEFQLRKLIMAQSYGGDIEG